MIDLHAHSLFSDGSLSPEALIDYALARDIKVLALTDHDSVGGVEEAKHYAEQKDLRLIPGVELSVIWGNTPLHIIGLGIDSSNQHLQALLSSQFEARRIRAVEIGQKLEAVGLSDAYEKARLLSTDGLITRPHFAQALINEGLCKDMKSAFKRYLKRGKSAYVRVNWTTMEEGLRVMREAGGVTVIAHPLRYGLTNTKLRCLLEDFKSLGGLAIEVVSGISQDRDIAALTALCLEYDLMGSVGSDFHGPGMTPHVMGRLKPLPKVCRFVLDALDGEN